MMGHFLELYQYLADMKSGLLKGETLSMRLDSILLVKNLVLWHLSYGTHHDTVFI